MAHTIIKLRIRKYKQQKRGRTCHRQTHEVGWFICTFKHYNTAHRITVTGERAYRTVCVALLFYGVFQIEQYGLYYWYIYIYYRIQAQHTLTHTKYDRAGASMRSFCHCVSK